jgi:hypothetical protein
MNSKISIAFSFVLFSFFTLYSQVKRTIDPTNVRDGEQVEYCIQHKKMAALMQNTDYVLQKQQDDIEFAKALKKAQPKGVVYRIPIVFHVLHNNGVENISDEQIMDQLAILNRDFRKQNADTATVQSDFVGMPTDAEIEFVLATKAPNGTCFKGITRTMNALSYDGADGDAQVTAIRNGNDVFNGSWPGNKYLNVFICGEIGGAAGYTTNPSGWSGTSMTNGIWILHDYVGSIGTSSVGTSRAFTHEVGHWLNLSHTWGGNNNPGNASSCSTDDGVDDTPNCIGVTSCLINANTCNSVNSFWSYDVRDNVENYMDYSYCSKMYTGGQVDRMRAALQGTITGRFNLWQSANLTATGATGDVYLCKAQFTTDRTTICLGDSIQLVDDSYNVVSGWNWEVTPATGWTFASGSAANSQNPTINFSQPGLYTVKLTATDGSATDDEIKNNYIRVLPDPSVLPYWEGFESYSTLTNVNNWEVYNPNNNNAWTIENTTGHSGAQCAKLVNFGQGVGSVDELTSAPIDLSVIPPTGTVTLSFRYSYRKKTTADYEYLKVFVTSDCGETWAQRKTLGGNQLSSSVSSTSWKPTQQADWVTVHMINVTSIYFTPNFKMKFKFEGEGGNNIYLDDINLYAGSPSDNLVLSLEENTDLSAIELYPNPTDEDVNIRYSSAVDTRLAISILDLSGKVISTTTVQSKTGDNMVIIPTNGLATGTYLVQLGTNARVLKFVVN